MSNPWMSRRVIGFAHQGGALEGPAGTIEAMRLALANGSAALEFDLHLAERDALIVHHDPVVVAGDRSLPIRGNTLEALRALRHDLATLDEVLEAFPRVPLTVEIKALDAAGPAARALAGRPADAAAPLIVTSFSPRRVAAVRAAAPGLDTAPGWPTILAFWLASRVGWPLPIGGGKWRVVALQVALDLKGISVIKRIPLVRRVRLCDSRFVECAHKRSLAVHVWTLNDADSMRAALDAGADGIFTDCPSVLTAVLDERGERWTAD